jgi:hypothetical protein
MGARAAVSSAFLVAHGVNAVHVDGDFRNWKASGAR